MVNDTLSDASRGLEALPSFRISTDIHLLCCEQPSDRWIVRRFCCLGFANVRALAKSEAGTHTMLQGACQSMRLKRVCRTAAMAAIGAASPKRSTSNLKAVKPTCAPVPCNSTAVRSPAGAAHILPVRGSFRFSPSTKTAFSTPIRQHVEAPHTYDFNVNGYRMPVSCFV
jgi:hypothetical protein